MTNEQRWTKMSKHERAMAASLCTMHLGSYPMFLQGDCLWLVWQKFDIAQGNLRFSRKVRIVQDTYLEHHRQHPWGSNQGRALVHLAKWIRTGKMTLTYEDWERWCGHPVYLGNSQFLAAMYAHVYGGANE